MKKKNQLQSFADLVETAFQLLEDKNAALCEKYYLGAWQRWDFDQVTAELIFSHEGVARVRCKAQFIGSYSFISDTWMWAWHNESILGHLKVDAWKTREYGEEHSYEMLTHYGGACDELQAWQFAAVTLYVAGGEGVYSGPDSNGRSFLLIKEAEFVPGTSASPPLPLPAG